MNYSVLNSMGTDSVVALTLSKIPLHAKLLYCTFLVTCFAIAPFVKPHSLHNSHYLLHSPSLRRGQSASNNSNSIISFFMSSYDVTIIPQLANKKISFTTRSNCLALIKLLIFYHLQECGCTQISWALPPTKAHFVFMTKFRSWWFAEIICVHLLLC